MKIPLWVRYEEVAMEKVKEYAFTTVLNTSYEDAIFKVTDALKEEGFGVLTEIDVKSTLKKKLNVDFRKYKILGACNPPLAHKALELEAKIGTMLPFQWLLQGGCSWLCRQLSERLCGRGVPQREP